jgi:hypothetical protein
VLSAAERDRVRERLLARAEADTAVTGAALTGSHASGTADRWSDADLVLAVRGDLAPTVDAWTAWLATEFRARHHWDLPAGPSVVRVFLLPGWLEVDLTFTPETAFGPRGPHWHTVFGRTRPQEPFPARDRDTLAGLIWHHALHARVCIARDRGWQAEHWISAIRDHLITLACLRLGHPADYAKGAHLLPAEITAALEATLVRALTTPELHRALDAATELAAGELQHTDPALTARLRPMFDELRARGG